MPGPRKEQLEQWRNFTGIGHGHAWGLKSVPKQGAQPTSTPAASSSEASKDQANKSEQSASHAHTGPDCSCGHGTDTKGKEKPPITPEAQKSTLSPDARKFTPGAEPTNVKGDWEDDDFDP